MSEPPAAPEVSIHNRQRRFRINRRALAAITERLLIISGSRCRDFSLVLVDDQMMAQLNQQFHATAGPTDVLTFDYETSAEVIISVNQARANARAFGSDTACELVLYVAHGLLHLVGYNDHNARDRATMRAAEKRLLKQLTADYDVSQVIRRPPVRRSGL